MDEGDKILIRAIVTNESKMVNLHRKNVINKINYDRFLIWWPLTISLDKNSYTAETGN